ncbi:hypothetical protein SLS53_007690 [Cytospora paraplurivora]|uniref:RING-type domain-containing protein n=1 Tax=Cytospora paraplurivora TaxID=2898453 RepID=A0AAN9TZX3_9PEZI
MSCDEYDNYLADPLHFRSEYQRQQHRAEEERAELEAVRRAHARVEDVMRRRRRVVYERERREEKEEETRERAARREQRERQRHEEKEKERAERERQRRAEVAERRRLEDLQSERLIKVSTKACPRCAARIEKTEGCPNADIDIGRCRYEFCWECTGPWFDNGCMNCFGGAVIQYE